MKQMIMKRKFIFTLAAATMLILGSCGPKLHRYSCGGKKRCVSYSQTAKGAAETLQQEKTTREA